MRTSKPIFRAALAVSFATALAADAGAVITRSFNYQGFLLNKETNQPVDGSKHVRFLIYDVAAGGSPLFTETVCNVPMNRGRYEVEVGSNTSGGITPDIFINNHALWMQVEIAPTASCSGSFDPLSPRVRLQAAPFAFNSLYSSTASAATPVFSADVIGALPVTSNGAITISTNLFVQGGISVGSISPGQQLSVSGLVESQGVPGCDTGPDYTCGFKFPDGSVQVKAAAETKWELNGNDMYNITTGNIGISETLPRARLHISSGIGEPGDLVLISTGASDLIRMTGEGRVYANYFHGDGSNLTGTTAADLLRLLKAGDTMTGPLTLSGSSSMTIVNTNNSLAYSLAVTTDPARLAYHLAVTTSGLIGLGTVSPSARLDVAAPGAANDIYAQIWRDGAGVVVGSMSSTGVMKAAFFQGEGSGLTNVFSTDPTRVLKAGDTMDGPLTLDGSSLTVTGSAGLAVGEGEWLSVGASTAAHKIYIEGGMLATSSITAQGGFYGSSLSVTGTIGATKVEASSGVFAAFGYAQYSIETASGIKVNGSGVVDAPLFRGSGAGLSDVLGTDSTKLLKAGDTMTGNLRVEGASVSIFGYNNFSPYALTVATVPVPSSYALSVTTQGRVGVGVLSPSYPFHVLSGIGVTVPDTNDDARIVLRTGGGGGGYIAWDDAATPGKGILGMAPGVRDLVYRAAATSMSNGTEILRIRESGNFGIGTAGPSERFHVATNMLVSTASVSPILYISTTTGMVGVGTKTPSTHKLVVDGDMVVVSSLTVQDGIHGTIYGVIASTELYVDGDAGIGIGTPLARLHVVEAGDENYSLIVGSNNVFGIDYDMVVTTQGRVGIGLNTPLAKLHVSEGILIGSSLDNVASLQLNPVGGDSYIYFSDQAQPQKAAMGTPGGQTDFIFLAGGASNFTGGTEVYRIRKTGQFGIHSAVPEAGLHIGANTLISTAAVTPILYASTNTARVGVGTRSPSARLHLSSGTFYNDGAGAGITTLGSVTASAYYGNGSTLNGVITSTDVIVSDIAGKVSKSGDTMGALTTTGLTVNGAADFGSLPTKSTFTAEGFWQPRAMTTAELQGATPLDTGLVVYNSSIFDLCVSTGTGVADWAQIGSKGSGNCY
ncbi:MAG: hypothetical protein RQ748_08125 [Elusimicrobiales bacterium]|nr:hypothetical protein [Elusimicrobiales bacterium]